MSTLEVPCASSEAMTVENLEAFLRKRLHQSSLELQSISLDDRLIYANFLPLHDDWEDEEHNIEVEQKTVQSLVLRMLAKSDDGFTGERDATDETSLPGR